MSASADIVTFGCRLNMSESEVIRRHADAAGLRDAVIINSCAVTAEAERQAGQAIRRLKREHPGKRIIVTGCASHIDPQKFADMAEVDHVIANNQKLTLAAFEQISPRYPRADGDTGLKEPSVVPVALDPRLRGDDGTATMQRAFVQVQNGCNHRCTFCIIPYGRGASRSLIIGEVTAQVRKRVAEGFNEIVLTGVDIASYGRDLAERPTLGAMMRRVLAAIPELKRLRLSSLDPAAMDEDLWYLIEHEPRLMPHLHLSLQAGDDMVLKRMKRRHCRDDIFRLVERARNLRPDVIFGADLIAGFPTENEIMAQNTYDLVERCGLTWLHVFPYSARTGTPAARMPQVHGSRRKERAEKLRLLGEQAARAHYQSLIGQTIPVLVENNRIGCTPHFAKITLTSDAPIGHIVAARCLRIENYKVVAEIL